MDINDNQLKQLAIIFLQLLSNGESGDKTESSQSFSGSRRLHRGKKGKRYSRRDIASKLNSRVSQGSSPQSFAIGAMQRLLGPYGQKAFVDSLARELAVRIADRFTTIEVDGKKLLDLFGDEMENQIKSVATPDELPVHDETLSESME